MQDFDLPAQSRPARAVLWVMLVGLVLLLAWSSVAQIDQITRAPGQVIANARTQIVQSPDGGVLEQLRVKEGDVVKQGQIVAILEKGRASAAFADSRSRVAALQITVARLQAEVFNKPLVFAAALHEWPELITNQENLYKQRRKAIEEELAALQDGLRLAREELDMNLPLQKSGDVSRVEVLRIERAVADLQAQITNRRNKYLQDAQAEMNKAQEDLNTQLQSLAERKQLLEHTELLAPATGIVKNVKITTNGGVVRPGDEVLTILPTESSLVVEAKLRPADVGFIAVGQAAMVKLDAYDYAIFGSMKGHVTYISADTLTEDTRAGEAVYYRVHIKMDDTEFKGVNAARIQIKPGMTSSVEIKTGSKTVLAYLTKPITKTWHESMSER